ncbi:MAG TPA: hypothetical protein VMF89_16920, partial [Polyangiales bacterium]|nr:hypothetical protein [Polyangiales bacterium]
MSCRVYDSDLLQFGAERGAVTAVPFDAAVDLLADTAEPVIVPGCGNGTIEGRERCDIAIPRGQEGACPDGCDMRDGCLAHELAGQRCGARCAPIEITESVPGDGCCPSGATPETDSDCSATCGNGVIEADETCDPPESCPTQAACSTEKACTVAHITGAASACSARCQELPVAVCESGDGCCPDACTSQVDSDCMDAPPPEPPTTTTATTRGSEAGTGMPSATGTICTSGESCTEEQQAAECSAVHSGGRCHSCDCAYCAQQVALCEQITKETGGCARVVECALQNQCQGAECLCGANVTNCQNRPL